MADASDLRPYYDPDTFNVGYSVVFKKGIGLIDCVHNRPVTSSVTAKVAELSSSEQNSGSGISLLGFTGSKGGRYDSFGRNSSSDKNYLYDLEFLEYFDLNNISELFKNLVWNFVKNYSKVLLMQPLEILRLVLQVGYFDFSEKADSLKSTDKTQESSIDRAFPISHSGELTSNYDSDQESDYFRSLEDNKDNVSLFNSSEEHTIPDGKKKIRPRSRHAIDILSSIATQEGPFALFKGLNAYFIHQTLSHSIEAWITGFLSPFLGIPDPFFLDLAHLTEPIKSLWLTVLACVITSLILMPLDLIKVRLMLTNFNHTSSAARRPSSSTGRKTTKSEKNYPKSTRSIRESIRNFPRRYLTNPPPSITFLTVLHQFTTTIFRKSAPYILLTRFNIDSYQSPNLYTIANLGLLITEFFVKLPVENILRKEQVRFLLKPKPLSEDEKRVITIDNPDYNLIVDFNNIYYSSGPGAHADRGINRNEGNLSLWRKLHLMGLFSGWRVGVLNVIGFWGYNIIKNNGAELREERI